jgi:integrase
MAKRPRSRIYWRERGGQRRAYGDFRDYASVGGKLEALRIEGEKLATTDADAAGALIVARVKELDALARGRRLHGNLKQTTLRAFAREHLIAKARAERTTARWLEQSEVYLERAVAHFGAGRDLASIGVADVRAWAEQLAVTPSQKGGSLGGGTVRHHLNILSNLYRRAQGEGYVPPGYNPVAALMEKPAAAREEARWLAVHHAALLLEAARTVALKRADLAIPFLYPLLATFLLTGGRRAEVLGLEVADVSFDRKTVTFRVHDHRRLKTPGSSRVVPLWPQLEAILKPYADQRVVERGGRLLFPVWEGQAERMVGNFDKALDQLAERAGWKAGEIRTKMFRHNLLRGPAPDDRPGGTGEPLHGGPRARPRGRRPGPPGLRPPRHDPPSDGRCRVSGRAVCRGLRRAAQRALAG